MIWEMVPAVVALIVVDDDMGAGSVGVGNVQYLLSREVERWQHSNFGCWGQHQQIKDVVGMAGCCWVI